ncbi:MAG: heat-shock protein HtpX, partial [Candidatus Nanopelagicaceae bacterium]
VLSAGSAPKDSINPVAVQAMAEVGIDIANNVPKILTDEAVITSDVVITMGCGDTCKFYPGKRYEDWQLEDPAGKGLEEVRIIRDQIKERVVKLLSEL